MGHQSTFHAPHGGADFLGWRKTRPGATEIVYDDGVARRMVWRVASAGSHRGPHIAMRCAWRSAASAWCRRFIDELKKRAIAIERVAG